MNIESNIISYFFWTTKDADLRAEIKRERELQQQMLQDRVAQLAVDEAKVMLSDEIVLTFLRRLIYPLVLYCPERRVGESAAHSSEQHRKLRQHCRGNKA